MRVEIRLTMVELANLLDGVEVGNKHAFTLPEGLPDMTARIDGEIVVLEWDD